MRVELSFYVLPLRRIQEPLGRLFPNIDEVINGVFGVAVKLLQNTFIQVVKDDGNLEAADAGELLALLDNISSSLTYQVLLQSFLNLRIINFLHFDKYVARNS